MEAFDLELGGCEAGLQRIAERVNSGLGALLLDGDQTVGEGLLLACGIELAVDRVQLNVRR